MYMCALLMGMRDWSIIIARIIICCEAAVHANVRVFIVMWCVARGRGQTWRIDGLLVAFGL